MKTPHPPKIKELHTRIIANKAILKRQRKEIKELKRRTPAWQCAASTIINYPLGELLATGWDEHIGDYQSKLAKLQLSHYELLARQKLMRASYAEWYKHIMGLASSFSEQVESPTDVDKESFVPVPSTWK